ncbi:hypothetical protein [endosymbiont of Lamellibrachia barhami]|uniref:hypothetical protein n=1 Tax=endosymbiont of Lamellibrachia barhami TaxID=205975 RepID=UPI001FE756DB|nr:hypothetical protein [endosymbiont of Lamellibrachia barhami]
MACLPRPQAYCAHEYTLDNLGFRRRLGGAGERGDQLRWLAESATSRELGRPTLPAIAGSPNWLSTLSCEQV